MKQSVKLFLLIVVISYPALSMSQERPLIGVSAPLSGPASAWGIDLKNVLNFANEKLAQGKYEFIFEDDKCSPKEAVTIANKFVSIDKVRAVFIVCGATTLAAAPIYEKAGVLLMAPLATPSAISSAGDYVFRTGLNDAFAAEVLARRISAGHRSVAVLTEQNDYSVGFLADFSRAAASLGLSVFNQDFQSSDTDFKGQILRIKGKETEAIFINSNTERLFAMVLRQAKEMKLRPAIYGAYLPGSSTFLAIAGRDAEGITFVDFPSAGMLSPEGRKLYQEFVSRYGKPQSWDYAFPSAFEAFRAVNAALASGESSKEFLYRSSLDGIFGRYRFDVNGDVVGISPAIKTIRGGVAEEESSLVLPAR